jgi:hypothetical protein
VLAREPVSPESEPESEIDELSASGVSVREWVAAADAEPGIPDLTRQLGAGSTRDIVVIHGPPDALSAVMVGWSIRTGAALMVEPDPARWPLAVVWARPTVVAGTGAELDRLAERLQRLEREPRRLRRRLGPLGRMRAVVLVGENGAASSNWWRSLGLPLLSCERPAPPR